MNAIIKIANEDDDILRHVIKLCKLKDYTISFVPSLKEDIKMQKTIFKIIETNMKDMYTRSDWGWKEGEKMKELLEKDARFLVVSNKEDSIVGFCHFRFEEEEELEVLYIYELQILSDHQGVGLGRRLMIILDLLGRKYSMKLLMLTTFKFNENALNFYLNKMKFEIDETSPSKCGDENACYEILSKCCDIELLKSLK